MRLPAYQRLFLSYLLVIVFLVVALSVGAESLLRRTLTEGIERQLERELRLAVAYYEDAAREAPDSVADLLGAHAGARITVIAPDGRVLGESTRDGSALAAMENHADRPEVRQARATGRGSAVRESETVGSDLLYAAMRAAGGEVLRISTPLTAIDAAVSRVHRVIFAVGGLAVLLAGLLSLGLSLAISRPLRRITSAALEAAGGNLGVRLRERRHDELGDLAGALDTLAEELQRRLQQLEGERAEMQALIDSMSEGVIALARDGTVRRANPAARRIFALPTRARGIPAEAVARRPDFLRLVRRALAGETVSPTEFASEGRQILANAHPLADGGALVVFLDVSELRRLEFVRRDFVANASHELKTPLTAIRGYSETLLDPALPPELARQFADIVKTNADRLQRIVDDLLDLSRIESGSWTIQPETVNLPQIATEAWSAQVGPLPRKRVELVLDIPPEVESALADPAAIRQIFENLFSNSLRYTPEGGTVTVRSRTAGGPSFASPGGNERWLHLSIGDSGSGIPHAHLPRIFERFYRVDPARSRIEGGTGLGLAIVKHLVEAHGGAVEAESQVGHGTTIRFSLPLAT